MHPQENDSAEMSGQKPEEMMDYSSSPNTIYLADDAYPDNKDGDKVSTQVEGTLMEHGGKKYLMVEMADGKPVQEKMEDEEETDTGELESQISQMGKKMGGVGSYR